jgi:integrase
MTMPYKRDGRPSFYFDGLLRSGGRRQFCTRTPDRRLAQKMEAMWDDLAKRHRAWDILDSVVAGRLTVGQLFDAWSETRQDVDAIRRRLADVDIEPLVNEWYAVHEGQVKVDSARHALAHVRFLLPESETRLASTVSSGWLSQRLASYPGSRNTRRKVHSSWSVFFDHLTRVRPVFSENPMARVDRPRQEVTPIRFYDQDTAERIVEWQPTEERRALFALLYGTGIEISVALGLTRGQIDFVTKEVRAPGTKTHTRDRLARVAEWAWPIVEAYARTFTPNAPLFPGVPDRYTASDWHRQTIGVGVKDTHGNVASPGLNLRDRYPMSNARHHWAVRRLRSGSSIYDVQRQLGHSSPTLTLRTYGQFIPTGIDRDEAERAATEYELRRKALR